MRITANLRTRLERNLMAYATAASAAGVTVLALVPSSEAKVIYRPADVVLGAGGIHIYDLDLNQDGITEIVLSASEGPGAYWLSAIGKVGSIALQGNSAAALPRGAEIGSKRHFRGGSIRMADVVSTSFSSSTFSRGPWVNVKNRYLGLKFSVDAMTYYGWAKLSVRVGPGITLTGTLTGYAYETRPNTPIIAGNTGGPTRTGPNTSTESASLGHLALGAANKRLAPMTVGK